MNLSVIIPVHNGGQDFCGCLQALIASTRKPDEIVVVDDASSDLMTEWVRNREIRLISLPDGPHGPAVARNRGAALAHGDILVFLDADVMVHPETLTLIDLYLTENPEIAALFGSYDDTPRWRSPVSLYKNLLHHFVHQHSKREASTFWAGCGAIRREVFVSLGGFSEEYTRPSIEDIELGVRLHRAGHRIWLCRDVQVKHLKRWKVSSLLRADIIDRAVPWSRLILTSSQIPSDLNLNVKSRISALVAWVMLTLLLLGFWLPWAWVGLLFAATLLGILNNDLYRFYLQRGGIKFAIVAYGLHTQYLLYSSLIFSSMLTWHLLQKQVRGKRHA